MAVSSLTTRGGAQLAIRASPPDHLTSRPMDRGWWSLTADNKSLTERCLSGLLPPRGRHIRLVLTSERFRPLTRTNSDCRLAFRATPRCFRLKCSRCSRRATETDTYPGHSLLLLTRRARR